MIGWNCELGVIYLSRQLATLNAENLASSLYSVVDSEQELQPLCS